MANIITQARLAYLFFNASGISLKEKVYEFIKIQCDPNYSYTGACTETLPFKTEVQWNCLARTHARTVQFERENIPFHSFLL